MLSLQLRSHDHDTKFRTCTIPIRFPLSTFDSGRGIQKGCGRDSSRQLDRKIKVRSELRGYGHTGH